MNQYKFWNSKETDRLRELWPEYSAKEITDKLNRTTGSIYKKIQHMGLTGKGANKGSGKHWTEEQEQFLRDNWYSMSSYEISDEIDKSPNAITSKVKRMNLDDKPTDYMYEDWDKEEEMFLLQNYHNKGNEEIANELDKTYNSVKSKKRQLNLSFDWEKWEDRILYDYYWCDCMSIKEIANSFLSHRNYNAIKHRVSRLGISAYPEEDETITCLNCGEEVVVKHYATKERRFCSQKCFFEYQGPTSIEEKMMSELDESGYDYEFQKEIGNYITDFFLEDMNLVIEADGEFWHDGVDQEREDFLLDKGYNVIHFTGMEINDNAEGCLTEALIQFGGVQN